MINHIIPDWPAPHHVKSLTTLRTGGSSLKPYDSFNCANHVGDDEAHVLLNRTRLIKEFCLPKEPTWLNQIHGTVVVQADKCTWTPEADASYSKVTNTICAVQTADCLPILLCNQNGTQIAAVHAGWRGLANGVIEETLLTFEKDHQNILAWLGPAIGPTAFEVGNDVVEAFVQTHAEAQQAFVQQTTNRWLANIYLLAQQRLNAQGITKIYGGHWCTVTEKEKFFSYRRDKQTGRMVSLIWME